MFIWKQNSMKHVTCDLKPKCGNTKFEYNRIKSKIIIKNEMRNQAYYNWLNSNIQNTYCVGFVNTKIQGQLIDAPPILCNCKIIGLCISHHVHSNFFCF